MSPERPVTVPEAARYDPNLPGWELVEHNAAGERHGECRLFRKDGTLERIFRFDAGKRVGPFTSFHATGELASRGDYVDDRLEGTFFKFVSKAPGSEPLRACCVPPSAVELRAHYRRGRLLAEVYYDAEGQPLKGDGTLWPPRPVGVPETATYEEAVKRYAERIENDDGTRGTIRYFGENGAIAEELAVADGRVVQRRRFDVRGELREECSLDSGVLHGAYRELVDARVTPYSDARIAEVRGELVRGEARGTWELLDAAGALVRRVERGEPFTETPALVLEAEPPDVRPVDLVRRAEQARANGQAREAVCLATRAAARAGDPEVLRAFLAESVLPLSARVALERAEQVAGSDKVTASRLLDAVLEGGDAARLLRALPSTLPRWCRASLEYVEAALLLAPERTLARVARALTRVEHGDRDGALADAELIARESTPAAELVREQCRLAFPAFRFEPLEDPVVASGDELLPVTFEQPLEAVRRAVALYATRLSLIRAELERRAGDAPWLPPSVDALLPEGPAELRRYTAKISDETEEGFEETEVSVDETIACEGRSVRQLLEAARVEFSALSWLCWSAGLDEVALPAALEARPLYAEAANRAALRCFWAFDRVRTGGLVALARNVPLFDWEGISISNVPHHVAEVVASEYLEVRAQFLWSMFPENVSPFQADLRRI